MRTFKILIVDDNPDNLNNAKAQFKNKNVELICSPLFSAAVLLLKRHTFDLVLTDLTLPGELENEPYAHPKLMKDVPHGLVLAIMAKNMNVPHVAIITDMSRHSRSLVSAVENLLGRHSFVSGHDQREKKWLAIAELYVQIVNTAKSEAVPLVGKRTLMLGGHYDKHKELLRKELASDFEVIFVEEDKIAQIPALFIEQNPDITFIIGELNKNLQFDQTALSKQLLRAKREDQQVLIGGFTKSTDPDPCFVRLPMPGSALRERLGLVASA